MPEITKKSWQTWIWVEHEGRRKVEVTSSKLWAQVAWRMVGGKAEIKSQGEKLSIGERSWRIWLHILSLREWGYTGLASTCKRKSRVDREVGTKNCVKMRVKTMRTVWDKKRPGQNHGRTQSLLRIWLGMRGPRLQRESGMGPGVHPFSAMLGDASKSSFKINLIKPFPCFKIFLQQLQDSPLSSAPCCLCSPIYKPSQGCHVLSRLWFFCPSFSSSRRLFPSYLANSYLPAKVQNTHHFLWVAKSQ